MKKIAFIATVPSALHSFMKGHIAASAHKWSAYVITHDKGAAYLKALNAKYIPISITRKPSPLYDLIATFQLFRIFRCERFDLIHSITPKAGLLSMLAGWLAGTPNRIHTFTGQVWVNKRGWKRDALKMFDKLIVLLATQVFVDSPSQRDFLILEGVLPPNKGFVIGEGSVCGVDTIRFRPDAELRALVRQELNIPTEAIAILFIGRMNADKGILDLIHAFNQINTTRSDVFLILVGPEEDLTHAQIETAALPAIRQLRLVSFTSAPERYLASSDIFCLPSYREGFGQVVIEAAATELPVVASRIYGVSDAVLDGKTGILFEVRNIKGLTAALLELIDNQARRHQMGRDGRRRAIELFSDNKITQELMTIYEQLLDK